MESWSIAHGDATEGAAGVIVCQEIFENLDQFDILVWRAAWVPKLLLGWPGNSALQYTRSNSKRQGSCADRPKILVLFHVDGPLTAQFCPAEYQGA